MVVDALLTRLDFLPMDYIFHFFWVLSTDHLTEQKNQKIRSVEFQLSRVMGGRRSSSVVVTADIVTLTGENCWQFPF